MLFSMLIPIIKTHTLQFSRFRQLQRYCSCVMCFKILEYVLLFKYQVYLSTSNLQFAFKENSSTTQCSWLLKEVIVHYNNKGSYVYSCLLDCSKAFDKVKHSDLFDRLLKWQVPPLITRIIMYMNGSMHIRLGEATSEYFTASNSIEQCSALSPILFSIYIDDLIERHLKAGWIISSFDALYMLRMLSWLYLV